MEIQPMLHPDVEGLILDYVGPCEWVRQGVTDKARIITALIREFRGARVNGTYLPWLVVLCTLCAATDPVTTEEAMRMYARNILRSFDCAQQMVLDGVHWSEGYVTRIGWSSHDSYHIRDGFQFFLPDCDLFRHISSVRARAGTCCKCTDFPAKIVSDVVEFSKDVRNFTDWTHFIAYYLRFAKELKYMTDRHPPHTNTQEEEEEEGEDVDRVKQMLNVFPAGVLCTAYALCTQKIERIDHLEDGQYEAKSVDGVVLTTTRRR
jgi:hypothetical protein